MLFHNMIPVQAFSKVLFWFVLVLVVLWGRDYIPMWSGVAWRGVAAT